MDNRGDQEGTAAISQGYLLRTGERPRRTHSLGTRPNRDEYLLCASLLGGQGMILRGDRWATGVTREALQPHLRAVCYRQESDRDVRTA